jgi:hypothetical protein
VVTITAPGALTTARVAVAPLALDAGPLGTEDLSSPQHLFAATDLFATRAIAAEVVTIPYRTARVPTVAVVTSRDVITRPAFGQRGSQA